MPDSCLAVSTPALHVRLLELQRPRRRNALDTALLAELRAAFDSAGRDDDVRCVVLTGNEQAFSAGADIHEMRDGGLAVLQSPKRRDSWAAIEHFPKPVIAAVNGFALGGGNELALLCDIVIASDSATFQDSAHFPNGTAPGDGVHVIWPLLLGANRGRYFLLTGQTLFHVILSQWPHLAARIAVMSGDPDADEEQEWLTMYRLPVIAKPFELARVFEMVERLCLEAERRQANGS